MLESMLFGSNFGILTWDSPNRLLGNTNSNSPDVSFAPAFLISYYKLIDEDEPRLRPYTNPH